MKARDLMSRDTECVAASDTLEHAAGRLAKLGVGAMPICGDDDRLMGMLTDRDIIVKAVAQGKDLARTLVSELAEGKPVTIGADDSVDETLRTMADARVRRLPVIDGRRLVGIVSLADVARHTPRRRSGGVLAAVSSSPRKSRSGRLALLPLLLLLGVAAFLWSRRRSGSEPTDALPYRAVGADRKDSPNGSSPEERTEFANRASSSAAPSGPADTNA